MIAVPDVPLDTSSRGEAAVIAARPSFLEPVWRDAHWRVFAVAGAGGYGAPGVDVRAAGPASLELSVDRPGLRVLRVRWTPYWKVVAGSACGLRAAGGWTALRTAGPGRVALAAEFDVARLVGRGQRCA